MSTSFPVQAVAVQPVLTVPSNWTRMERRYAAFLFNINAQFQDQMRIFQEETHKAMQSFQDENKNAFSHFRDAWNHDLHSKLEQLTSKSIESDKGIKALTQGVEKLTRDIERNIEIQELTSKHKDDDMKEKINRLAERSAKSAETTDRLELDIGKVLQEIKKVRSMSLDNMPLEEVNELSKEMCASLKQYREDFIQKSLKMTSDFQNASGGFVQIQSQMTSLSSGISEIHTMICDMQGLTKSFDCFKEQMEISKKLMSQSETTFQSVRKKAADCEVQLHKLSEKCTQVVEPFEQISPKILAEEMNKCQKNANLVNNMLSVFVRNEGFIDELVSSGQRTSAQLKRMQDLFGTEVDDGLLKLTRDIIREMNGVIGVVNCGKLKELTNSLVSFHDHSKKARDVIESINNSEAECTALKQNMINLNQTCDKVTKAFKGDEDLHEHGCIWLVHQLQKELKSMYKPIAEGDTKNQFERLQEFFTDVNKSLKKVNDETQNMLKSCPGDFLWEDLPEKVVRQVEQKLTQTMTGVQQKLKEGLRSEAKELRDAVNESEKTLKSVKETSEKLLHDIETNDGWRRLPENIIEKVEKKSADWVTNSMQPLSQQLKDESKLWSMALRQLQDGLQSERKQVEETMKSEAKSQSNDLGHEMRGVITALKGQSDNFKITHTEAIQSVKETVKDHKTELHDLMLQTKDAQSQIKVLSENANGFVKTIDEVKDMIEKMKKGSLASVSSGLLSLVGIGLVFAQNLLQNQSAGD